MGPLGRPEVFDVRNLAFALITPDGLEAHPNLDRLPRLLEFLQVHTEHPQRLQGHRFEVWALVFSVQPG